MKESTWKTRRRWELLKRWDSLGGCEHGDELWDSKIRGGFLDWLRNSYQRGLVAVRY
jgi:hypothetical protein